MEWGLISWGLLMGMVGLVWMFVLAIWADDARERTPKDSTGSSHEQEPAKLAHTRERIKAA